MIDDVHSDDFPDAAGLQDRVLGGLYGLLIGDALGVPFEFRGPEELPPLGEIDVVPPAGFRRAHPGAPVGAWSDDGAHALCLLASLLHCDGLDLEDLARRLLDWRQRGYMAVEGLVFDVGIQTSAALDALRAGVAPEEAGPAEERSNGNGSLMRVLPLALWHRGSDEELIRAAMRQSLITHGHLRSQLSCALYCLWARALLRQLEEPWRVAVASLRRFAAADPLVSEELERHVRPDEPPQGSGTGYVVDCLHSARWAMQGSSFAEVVRRAIALGNDTDTTAAVAGGVAGIRFGFSQIPPHWVEHLAEKETVEPLASALVDSQAVSCSVW